MRNTAARGRMGCRVMGIVSNNADGTAVGAAPMARYYRVDTSCVRPQCSTLQAANVFTEPTAGQWTIPRLSCALLPASVGPERPLHHHRRPPLGQHTRPLPERLGVA